MPTARLAESHVEEHTLAWLRELGYSTLFGPDIAPDTLAAERKNYGDVILRDRFMQAIAWLNPEIPAEVRERQREKSSTRTLHRLSSTTMRFTGWSPKG